MLLKCLAVLVLSLQCVCSFVIFKEPQDSLSKQMILDEKTTRERLQEKDNGKQCYPLSIPICRRLGYNSTSSVVDIYGNRKEEDREVAKYLNFFENELCFEDLLFFVCTLFNPICFKNHPREVLPCRSECRNVKKQCKGTIQKFQLKWPALMRCNNLPEYEADVCLTRKSIVTAKQFDNVAGDHLLKTHDDRKCHTCKPRNTPPQYHQFAKAGYAIEGQYLSKTNTADGGLKLSFLVKKLFKQGSVPIIKHGIIHIWSHTKCLCPQLTFDHKYILIGHEDEDAHRLVIDQSTFVIPKTRFWKRLLIQWKRKFRIYLRQQLRI